jgi:hypothetical protein
LPFQDSTGMNMKLASVDIEFTVQYDAFQNISAVSKIKYIKAKPNYQPINSRWKFVIFAKPARSIFIQIILIIVIISKDIN